MSDRVWIRWCKTHKSRVVAHPLSGALVCVYLGTWRDQWCDIADMVEVTDDPVYEWADLPEDRSAGWVDLKSMRDELVEDGVLVRLEVPE